MSKYRGQVRAHDEQLSEQVVVLPRDRGTRQLDNSATGHSSSFIFQVNPQVVAKCAAENNAFKIQPSPCLTGANFAK